LRFELHSSVETTTFGGGNIRVIKTVLPVVIKESFPLKAGGCPLIGGSPPLQATTSGGGS